MYEVEHVRTGRRLALKAIIDSSQAARLEQEAKATAKLRSRHAVRVVDLGTHAGNPYLVMSLLEGRSLREHLLERTKIDLAMAANIVLQLAECLDEAHGLGLVHRDLKPENIFLSPLKDGADSPLFDVTVLDFGVVKVPYDDVGTQLTRTGSTVGTPFYMSLEQLRGAATVDAQSDVYSLSVLLYESFTGTVPFQAATLGDLVFAICSAPPVALKIVRPELPAGVSDVVMAGLSSSKTDRPKSMRAVAEAFKAHADPAFSLWMRGAMVGSPETPSAGPVAAVAEASSLAGVADKLAAKRPDALSPKPSSVRLPLSDPPTTVGSAPAPRVPVAPRLPSLPKPAVKGALGDAKAAALLIEPPKISPPPGVIVPPSRPLASGVSPGGLPGAQGVAAARAASGSLGADAIEPIDEPSTTRDDDDDPPTALGRDRDRDTPTEMFVKDIHGNVRPPGMVDDASTSDKSVDAPQYPTMNLDIGIDPSESTAILSLPIGGTQSTPSSVPTSSARRASPVSSAGVDAAGAPSDSSRPSLSGISAPTFGTPSQAFLVAPPGQGAATLAHPGAYPYAPPGLAGQGPSSGVTSSGGTRSIDVFMNRVGRSGNAFAAKALTRFRTATPGQQALVVGIAAAIFAVIFVTLVFWIFF